MLPELGQIALLLALLVAATQAVVPLLGAHRGIAAWMAVARPAAFAQLFALLCAFAILTASFVQQDFSVKYVADNSNTLLPMVYRFTAVWGSHEGSLLLWALVLALWSAAVAEFSHALPETVVARVLGTMGLIACGFLSFLIFTSNPFTRLLPAPFEGRDLNPLLQDPGMIVHPPMLYLGYVGFSVPFAFAIAALLEGNVDARWLRWTRPWTNAAWGFLTCGITLGSWWAYKELGWGGWWFWDPVENASFMPWLAGTALIHSQAVTEKRSSFPGWTLLLAIAAFSLSLLGTFLVRSGVITSVHSFAADPARGLFILVFLFLVIGGSLLLYASRAPKAGSGKPFAAWSRETLLLVNNLLLASACAMVLLGTLYPLLADALHLGKISVGPPYFGLLFFVLTAPLVALVPFGPLVKWQREQSSKPLAMLLPWLALALIIAAFAYFVAPQGKWKVAAGAAASVWVAFGTLRFMWTRLRANGKFTAEMLGMCFAHIGIALFVIGAVLGDALAMQHELAMMPGDVVAMGDIRIAFDGVGHDLGANYEANRGNFRMLDVQGKPLAKLIAEKREYASGGQVMTEAGIDATLARDVYVSLGEDLGGGGWSLRVQVKPFVRWIWIGALLMALGGFVTATDRRFRKTGNAK